MVPARVWDGGDCAQACPVTDVLYLNVWAGTYRALPFERFVCNPCKKYIFTISCAFDFSAEKLKQWILNENKFIWNLILENSWGFSKLPAIQFAFHTSYCNANKSKNTVKVTLQIMCINQILFQEFCIYYNPVSTTLASTVASIKKWRQSKSPF